jgi:5-deoxy-D-glucuronate isomerase
MGFSWNDWVAKQLRHLRCEGTTVWQHATFKLQDANFANRYGEHADFGLRRGSDGGELVIRQTWIRESDGDIAQHLDEIGKDKLNMEATLVRYRERIRRGEVNPMVQWDGHTSGTIFDPAREDVPLTMLGFGAVCLDAGPYRLSTREREFVFVPVSGRFDLRVGPESFRGEREGGPFATMPEVSNASAIYAPADSQVEIFGTGEMVYFSAPAMGHKPPAFIEPGQRETVSRGTSLWLRRVVTLFAPENITTVLVGGETYSPPGLWSGTPLHIHDLNDPEHGQSDHEEVYYHVARNPQGRWGPYGVQLLFDDQGLDNAYMIHHRSAFAVPGAAHPVVAGPNSDLLYIWTLAGTTPELKMMDVHEFAYLKTIGAILDELLASRTRQPLTRDDFQRLVTERGLDSEQAHVLRMHLQHQGIRIV